VPASGRDSGDADRIPGKLNAAARGRRREKRRSGTAEEVVGFGKTNQTRAHELTNVFVHRVFRPEATWRFIEKGIAVALDMFSRDRIGWHARR
jgi:hypothetical protein